MVSGRIGHADKNNNDSGINYFNNNLYNKFNNDKLNEN